MKRRGPRDERGTANPRPDTAEMDTFSLGLPRWPVLLRLMGRGPLVRRSDRIEALVLVLALVVAVLAIPVAAAVGTAVHDSNRHLYAEQARTSHLVTATVTEVPANRLVSRTGTIDVVARWTAAGGEHTGDVSAPSSVQPGDTIEVWVDDAGARVSAPNPPSRAAWEGAAAAFALWFAVAATMTTLFAVTMAICDHVRWNRWQHELNQLVDNDGYHRPGHAV
jgi:hypothetical protein